ncbi:MAG: nicotinate phosphoribosyltransferase [Lactobacillaceae bacterium]|jgi:nicotinamide phosphoribosyltransferase|nr:nicotinate phosphoribosyltransferase [Lactobacillaceae bacterium]
MENLIIATDAYKFTHHLQYPKGLTKMYSYGEARTGGRFNVISWFGLQILVKQLAETKFTQEMVDEAAELSRSVFGSDAFFNRAAWEKVVKIGYLPIKIKSLPEGMNVPAGTPLFTIESTQSWFATALNSLETFLMHVWYPSTIATNSMNIKLDLIPLFEKTGDVNNIELAVNDFGLRGATSLESGKRGGAGHLLHFRGTDNLAADQLISDVYDFKGRGLSVWATEHSVATSYGYDHGEFDYVNAQLDRADDSAIVSIVIDSYDSINFILNVIGSLEIKQKIQNKKGRVVLRPDSGEPKKIDLEILELLEKIFGSTVNEKGYKLLNYNVGIIQGDGMKRETIVELYEHIIEAGWSADNLVVGSGGGLLQEDFTRDTERFAIKASYVEFDDGRKINLKKQPKQDLSKTSKSGRFKVIRNETGHIVTKQFSDEGEDLLRTLYEDGQFFPDTFENILTRRKY